MQSDHATLEDLLEKIRHAQKNFSPAQRLVAAYVLENSHQVPFLSITRLSEKIGVSDNSVIKFCNGIGYSRFAEFKKDFSNRVHAELLMSNKLSQSEKKDDLFSAALEENTISIHSTLTAPINAQSLKKALPLIEGARNIYIIGGRASGFIAGYFANALRYLGLTIIDVNFGMGDFWTRLSMIQEGDLLIAISLPRYTAQIVEGVKMVHGEGIPVILITDTGLSPALPYADVVFHCAFASDSYFPCYSGCVALISTICFAISTDRKEVATGHIEKLEQTLIEQGVFC